MGLSLMICCDIHNGRWSEIWRNRRGRKETTTNLNIFGTNKPLPYPRYAIDVICNFIDVLKHVYFIDHLFLGNYQKRISIAAPNLISCLFIKGFYIFSMQLK